MREHRSAEQVIVGSNSRELFEITRGIFSALIFWNKLISCNFFAQIIFSGKISRAWPGSMDHSLYVLITETKPASLPYFIGNLTVGIHSSSGEFLQEKTSNIKIHFVGRFAVGSGSVSKTVCLDKDICRRHVKLTKVDANRWETLTSYTTCVDSGWPCFRCLSWIWRSMD